MKETMNKKWIDSEEDMLKSILADEAKGKAILDDLANTIHQLRAKSSFRLALLNTLLEHKGIDPRRKDKY